MPLNLTLQPTVLSVEAARAAMMKAGRDFMETDGFRSLVPQRQLSELKVRLVWARSGYLNSLARRPSMTDRTYLEIASKGLMDEVCRELGFGLEE